jgi:ApaG protein
VVASAAASDANSSSNPPGRDERDEAARKEKAAAWLLMRSQKYAMLKQQLAVAAQFEVGEGFARKSKLCIIVRLNRGCPFISNRDWLQDYKEAARLRDSLRSFEEEEPVLRLRRLMKKATEEERFEVVDSCSLSLFLPIPVLLVSVSIFLTKN